MITLQDLFLHLEQLLTPAEFADVCPNGIQVEGKNELKKLVFAVSASLAAIEEAVKRGADALIVHHGIFWQNNPYPVVGTKKQKLALLLEHGISLLAYHIPLDAHPQIGNNWKAAHDLGFENLEPFGLFNKKAIGVKGTFPPIALKDFQHKIVSFYGHPAHAALGGKPTLSSAAIISGGAHKSIQEAADAGVDCFITGSFDEPVWDIAHERKIHFFALGHYATERVGVLALMAEVKKRFGLSCEFVDFPNPF